MLLLRHGSGLLTEVLRDKNGLTEEEFLRQYRSDKYPKPSLTADILVFRKGAGNTVHLLMVRRKGHPFLGCLALPGGFAKAGETIESTAARELLEETGISDKELKLVGVYSRPGRDPRGWTVSVAYAALAEYNGIAPTAGDDAASVHWIPLEADADGCYRLAANEALAFDHADIITDAIRMMFPKSLKCMDGK